MSYKAYWEKYYQSHKMPESHSLFAEFVFENYLKSNLSQSHSCSLLELGCGNGRDATYFAKNKIYTTAIDQASNEIAYLQEEEGDILQFIAGDFTKLHDLNLQNNAKETINPPYDCIYSRFTLHSINADEQERLFLQIPFFLKKGGIFAIESRGYKNSLYQKGEPVLEEKDAFIYDSHYRRFVRFGALVDCICSLDSFEILYAAEKNGFAPFNGEDDIFMRIIARFNPLGGGGNP